MEKLRLYHYWRSSCSWRVRWALNHKGLDCELVAVDLLSGEVEGPEHRKRNPLGYVPVLELCDSGRFLSESMAIMEWLDETCPQTSLLPGDAFQRARIRQLAETINADTQPLQNLNPQDLHSSDPAEKKRWCQHWIRNGLEAYEKVCADTAGRFSVGDFPTLADLCLIPQVYNANRYEVPLDGFPRVRRIYETALALESCKRAAPENHQPNQK